MVQSLGGIIIYFLKCMSTIVFEKLIIYIYYASLNAVERSVLFMGLPDLGW